MFSKPALKFSQVCKCTIMIDMQVYANTLVSMTSMGSKALLVKAYIQSIIPLHATYILYIPYIHIYPYFT